jgi:opacity protein-like surface antigen
MNFRQYLLCLTGVGAALAAVQPVQAQSSGDGFLFREPVASLTLRGGFGHAGAASDLFSFTREQLTLGRGDFSGPALGADVAIRVAPRLDLAVGVGYSGARATSEFRDWVDDDDLPIEQVTTFERVPVTANVKAYLTPRGRSIGTLAWLPARAAPYVGAGGGAMWYRFQQQGDFVDFETLEIFSDELVTSGWAPTAQALAGLDFSLTPRIALTGEARYAWARAEPGDAFQNFDPIDLSGVSATLGVTFRF